MPVYLAKVDATNLEAQPVWQQDLHKLYAENSNLDAPVFMQQALAAKQNWFAGALFNDHLLGAVLVEETSQGWRLSQLQVRQTTQRRGVATRLLQLVCQAAAQAQVQLDWSALTTNPAAVAFLAKDDFSA